MVSCAYIINLWWLDLTNLLMWLDLVYLGWYIRVRDKGCERCIAAMKGGWDDLQ